MNKSFRWYFIGRSVSVLGSAMTPVALAFAVLQTTDDPKYLGYVLAAAMTPTIALMLLGGSVADRIRQDRLLLATNLGSGVTQAAVAACVLTHQQVRYLIGLAFANGLIQAFSGPAMSGMVPRLVPAESLQKANALLASSRNTAQLLGPSVAGLLVGTVGGGWGIAADSLSFFISAACMSRLSLPDPPGKGGPGLLKDLREGFRAWRRTAWLWPISLAFMPLNVIQLGVWQVLGPILARGSIGAGGWALVLSARAAGLLTMSTLMGRVTLRRPFRTALPVLALAGTPLTLLGTGAGTAVLAPAAFLAGAATGFYTVLEDTARHSHIPQHLMSRVIAFDEFGAYVAIPVGQLAAVPVATAFGARHVALVGGFGYAAAALTPLLAAAVRMLGSRPPRPAETQPSSRPRRRPPRLAKGPANRSGRAEQASGTGRSSGVTVPTGAEPFLSNAYSGDPPPQGLDQLVRR